MAKTLVLQLHQHLGGQDEVVDCVHHSVGGTEVALVDFGVVDEEIAVVALQEDQGVFVMVGSLEHHGVTHADTGDKTRGFRLGLDFLESDWLLLKHDDHDNTGKLPPSKHTGATSLFGFFSEKRDFNLLFCSKCLFTPIKENILIILQKMSLLTTKH